MNTDLIIVFFASTFIIIFLFLLVKAYNKKYDKTPFWQVLLGAISFGLLATIISAIPLAINDISKTVEGRVADLEVENYRYTKEITTDSERDEIVNNPAYLENVCNGNEYKVVNKGYSEMSINSHLFYEKPTYIYCEDKVKHENKVSSIDLEQYKFFNKFPEYPSSQAILEFCSLHEAVIVDGNMEPVTVNEFDFLEQITSPHSTILFS